MRMWGSYLSWHLIIMVHETLTLQYQSGLNSGSTYKWHTWSDMGHWRSRPLLLPSDTRNQQSSRWYWCEVDCGDKTWGTMCWQWMNECQTSPTHQLVNEQKCRLSFLLSSSSSVILISWLFALKVIIQYNLTHLNHRDAEMEGTLRDI